MRFIFFSVCLIILYFSGEVYSQEKYEPELQEVISPKDRSQMKEIIGNICADIKKLKNKYVELKEFGSTGVTDCGDISIRYFPYPFEESAKKETYIDIYFDKKSFENVLVPQKRNTKFIRIYIKDIGYYLHGTVRSLNSQLRKEIIGIVKKNAKFSR
jgi:hypothetical protein